jgi:multicomponent K+:H+ antiporter subunit G
MIDATELPPLVAVLVALLVLVGAALALIGSLGLLRLPTFYERVHPPTMGTTLGVAFTLVASTLLFSALESRPVLHEVVIGVFVVVTTPVTYMLLLRAAVDRRRSREEPRSE